MNLKTYKQNASLVSRKVDDHLVLVPVNQNIGDLRNIFTLNEVGIRIWELIEEERTYPEIFSILHDEYEVSEDRLRNDIGKFLDNLESAGAVVIGQLSNGTDCSRVEHC